MKQAVSVSLGSRTRDKEVTIEILGERISLRREGWDGDVAKTAARFTELDGRIDAFGVGGIDLWVGTDTKRYPLRAAHKLVAGVRQTPVVDGSGLKQTLERQVVPQLIHRLGERYASGRVLLTAAVDRFGMAQSFFDHDYEVICGDLGFALGLPLPLRTLKSLRRTMGIVLPLVSHLPISVLYPTGEKQEENHPRFEDWYAWADVIAGDCIYIKQHMPADLSGKVIVTNTTTEADRALFAARGVAYILTTTPVINGRSFGTNLLEAGLTAVADKRRPLIYAELTELIQRLDLKPSLHNLREMAA